MGLCSGWGPRFSFKHEDTEMIKKRPPLTPVVRFKLFIVFVGMAIIWYFAQMLVYVEVLIILKRLGERF